MLFLSIAHDYFVWHYSRAFREIFGVWLNFLWFTVNFFSIPQLARSWFSPFKRITEQKRSGFSFDDVAGYIIINLFSRFVGALLRSILIGVGVLVLVAIITIGIAIYLTWLFLPILIVGSMAFGVSLLFI